MSTVDVAFAARPMSCATSCMASLPPSHGASSVGAVGPAGCSAAYREARKALSTV